MVAVKKTPEHVELNMENYARVVYWTCKEFDVHGRESMKMLDCILFKIQSTLSPYFQERIKCPNYYDHQAVQVILRKSIFNVSVKLCITHKINCIQ